MIGSAHVPPAGEPLNVDGRGHPVIAALALALLHTLTGLWYLFATPAGRRYRMLGWMYVDGQATIVPRRTSTCGPPSVKIPPYFADFAEIA
jgi:hypothetical protein